jgi:hypothetical protein
MTMKHKGAPRAARLGAGAGRAAGHISRPRGGKCRGGTRAVNAGANEDRRRPNMRRDERCLDPTPSRELPRTGSRHIGNETAITRDLMTLPFIANSCSVSETLTRVESSDSWTRNGELFMIKSLAALGLTAALAFTPAIAFAQDATPTPAMDAKPMKPMKHKMKAKHVMKKSMKKMKMMPKPTPTPTDAPN